MIGDADWESVALEVGAAFALAGVLVWIERSLAAEVEERVRGELDLRDSAAVLERTRRDNEVIDAFVADPSTYSLWAIAGLCGAVGVDPFVSVETDLGGCVSFRPDSAHRASLHVGAPPGMRTDPGGSRWSVQWDGHWTLDQLAERVADAFKGNAEAVDLTVLCARAADIYRRRLLVAYERLPDSQRS